MGIEALINAFPVTSITSESLAILRGFPPKDSCYRWGKEITFHEPPAGWHVPFVNPVEAMTILFTADGMTDKKASARAASEFTSLRTGLSVLDRPRLYQGDGALRIPECISVPHLVNFLQGQALVSDELTKFIGHACAVTCTTKLYSDLSSNSEDKWRLDELPDTPLPRSMIEFFAIGTSIISSGIIFSYNIHKRR